MGKSEHGMSDDWLVLLHLISGRLLADRRLRRDQAQLVEELVADGFESAEVALALAWVERLSAGLSRDLPLDAALDPGGERPPDPGEVLRVSPAAFGLLLWLERAGAIDGATREEILARALALGSEEVGEEELRAISREVLEAAARGGAAAEPGGSRPRGRHLH